MAEINKKDIISDEALAAPLELAKNVDKAVEAIIKLVDAGKKSDSILKAAKSTKELSDETNKLTERQKELAKIDDQITLATQRNNKEYIQKQAELRKTRSALNEAVKAELNAESAYKKTSDRLNKLRAAYKDVAASQGVASKAAKDMLPELQRLDAELKEIDKSAGQFNRNVGNYPNALGQAFGEVGSLLNVTTLGIGAAVTGTFALGKAFFDEGKRINKAMSDVSKLTQLAGKDLELFTARASAISDVFERDFNEVIKAGNVLMKEFGLSGSEGLDIVNQAIIRGVDLNEDFLEQFAEYSTFISAAGGDAQDLVDILLASEQAGVFSDKGLDSIKEATIRIREMTPATRDAIAGLGLSVDEIEKGLREGSISVMDVIKQVSNRISELPPISKEVGTAIADIFGGAGEDAGSFLFQLGKINTAQGDWRDTLTETQKAQMGLLEATEEYERTLISTAGNFSAFQVRFDTFITNVKTSALQVLASLAGAFTTLNERITAYKKSIDSVQEEATLRREIEALEKKLEDGNSLANKFANAIKSMGSQARFSTLEMQDMAEVAAQLALAKSRLAELTKEVTTETKEETQTVETGTEAIIKRAKALEELDVIQSSPTGAISGESVYERDVRGAIDAALAERNMLDQRTLDRMRFAEKWREINEKLRSEESQVIQEIYGTGLTAFIDYQNGIAEVQQERIDRLNDQRTQQLALFEGDQEKQQEILETFAAEEEKLRARQNKAKRRAAIADKALRIAQATINTATGVSGALATLNIPLAVLIGILGAAQIGVIAAAQIPEFAEGVRGFKGGLAIVNDGNGQELIRENGKYRMVESQGAALTYLKPGADVFTAEETNKMLTKGVGKIGLDQPKSQTDQIELITEVKRLNKRLGNLKQLNMNITEKGVEKAIRSGQNILKIINEDFK